MIFFHLSSTWFTLQKNVFSVNTQQLKNENLIIFFQSLNRAVFILYLIPLLPYLFPFSVKLLIYVAIVLLPLSILITFSFIKLILLFYSCFFQFNCFWAYLLKLFMDLWELVLFMLPVAFLDLCWLQLRIRNNFWPGPRAEFMPWCWPICQPWSWIGGKWKRSSNGLLGKFWFRKWQKSSQNGKNDKNTRFCQPWLWISEKWRRSSNGSLGKFWFFLKR